MMFKSAATRLAHNSTIPALAGNKDLRPLQDLITAEKAIVTSLARLSGDFIRASEALRNWGLGEGEDLSDTLGGSTKILLEFSSSLSQFAVQEQSIREHMKAIRTQEEKLDTIKHRRKNVASKADSAERKLNKMDSTHKNTPVQSELLTRLRDEIRELDSEIMTEEAKLGDLKRTATKSWMTLKFGGLQEFSRKGLIIAEAGKLIMTELSQVETEPGSARPFYTGQPRTEIYVADALRTLGEVLFDNSVPPDRVLSPQADINQASYPNLMLRVSSERAPAMSVGIAPGGGEGPSQNRAQHGRSASGSGSLAERGSHDIPLATFQADALGTVPPQPDQPRFQTFNAPQNPPPSTSNTFVRDDMLPPSLQFGSSAAPGGRFVTFPVKGKRKGSLQPAVGEPQDGSRSTFTEEMENPQGDPSDPVPRYEVIERVHTPPPAPPPGAAPPAMPQAGLYGSHPPRSYDSGPSNVPGNAGEEEEESQLAYMEPPQSERRVRFGSRPIEMPRQWSDLDNEIVSGDEPNGRAQTPTESGPQNFPVQSPLTMSPQEDRTSPVLPQAPSPQDRIPSPPYALEEPEDERALSAAAAREVSRELDALMYSPPVISSRAPPLEPSSPVSLTISPAAQSSPRSSISNTQPSPPFARTRDLTPGSPTTPRSSTEQPSPTNVLPAASAPSDPSSPTQRALPHPSIGFPLAPPPSLSSVGTAPFHTPPEVPPSPIAINSQRPLPQPPAVSASPGKTPPLPPPGARTISAAAFRRPVPRMVPELPAGTPEVSPLSIKKRDLRGSPQTAHRIGGTFGSGSTSSLPSVQPPEPPLPQPQERRLEDDFDYISAYYNSGGDDLTVPAAISESRGRL
ncbi:hypothetical protein BJV78DRAFT_1184713 [Lactifluus subvellereus]|nr:hypothetical protein BJV78DRAFT_1184713 [Lactifluus subvellereus]